MTRETIWAFPMVERARKGKKNIYLYYNLKYTKTLRKDGACYSIVCMCVCIVLAFKEIIIHWRR